MTTSVTPAKTATSRATSTALSDPVSAYRNVRNATATLAAPLSPEDCTTQSMPDASPTKWHLGHTTWFFETLILEAHVPDYKSFAAPFRVLFNSYYNSIGAQHPRPRRGLLSRPSLDEVLAYRDHVDRAMQQFLSAGPDLDRGIGDVLEVGLNHEQQHQELLLTDIKHLLSCNPLKPAYRPKTVASRGNVPVLNWQAADGGVVWIGHDRDDFAYDNEKPRHRVFLEPFEIASRPVTNGEYLEFIRDGGYSRPDLWLSDGWTAIHDRRWTAPLYWEQVDGEWTTFTLNGRRPWSADEPICHVSYYEADAYARWKGCRLPSEAEWETVASDVAIEGNFVETGILHPAAPQAASPLAQIFGDVWEWTRSGYEPYPGYVAPEGPLGEYNSKFMCSQLVLRGGSCATPRSHIRPTYRNFFPPHARWQFSGIRLARDAS